MTGLGLPGNGVLYAYEDNSNLVAVTAYVDTNDTPYGQSTRTFEDHRNLVHTVENQWKVSGTMTTISMYDYASDALGRRTSVINTGTAFSPNRFTLWTYEAPATPEISRGELLTSKRYDGTDIGNTNSPVSTQQFAFDYDAAGNRQWHTGSSSEGALSYTTNKLNQYTSTTTPDESFTYDRAGNLTHDGKNEYAYDAENRLVLVTPNRPTGWVGTLPVKVQFTYDCLGRRVRKVGWTWDPNLNGGRGDWSPQMSLDRRFVYDGRNLIEELNGLASNFPLFKYTWGLDLAAQGGASGCGAGTASPGGLHAAEGVAGLLAMYDTKGTSFAGDDRWMAYFYNGNGDVGQLIDSNPSVVITFGSTQARYEYYPFGGLLVATGPYAATNSIRYSTRYRDTENSLYYFGRRFLITRLGRWLNADPKGEAGGLNLYEAMHNDPVDRIDPLGLACASGSCGGGASTMWVTPWLPLLPPCLPLASPPTGLPPMVKGGGGSAICAAALRRPG